MSTCCAITAPGRNGWSNGDVVLEVAGTRVFAKRVPLTELERRHPRSTANVFDLPAFYQYRIGSSGFAAWRELAAHELTTAWEIEERCGAFPLLHHGRVLAVPPGPAFDPEPLVAAWGGSSQIRARLEAIAGATASVVLFIEYVPETVRQWLSDQTDVERAFAMVEREALRITQLMRAHDFLHLDPHFANILTDGERLYVSDFGLATSRQFTLTEPEGRFFDLHKPARGHPYLYACELPFGVRLSRTHAGDLDHRSHHLLPSIVRRYHHAELAA
jgi:hypothetical protein